MNKFFVLFCLTLTSVVTMAQTNFRSNGTGGGLWSATSTWQVEIPNGSNTWFDATSTPTSTSNTIEIRANDIVTVSSNITIDQTTVDASGTLIVSDGIKLTLNLGSNALVIDGTLNMLGESQIAGGGSSVLNGTLMLGSLNSVGALVGSRTLGGNFTNPGTYRTFNANSQIVYAGLGAQIIGSGHPKVAGVITVINNSNGVTFNTTASGNSGSTVLLIPSDLILTNGNLNIVSTTTARSLTLNGNITANANNITFSGSNTSLTINGTGALGTFPFPAGSQTIKNLAFNRTSGSVAFNNSLTILGTTTITSGTITLGGATTIAGNVTLSSGTVLAFDGQALSMANNYVSSGKLSASGASSLTLTGSLALTSPIDFLSTNKTLQSLTINKTNSIGTSVQVGASGLNVTNTLTLTDGVFDISSGLVLSSGSTFNFNASGSTPSSISQTPTGGPWTLNYSGTASRTTGSEIPASGILNALNYSATGTTTLNEPLTIGNGGIIQSAGYFKCSSYPITSPTLTINGGTFTAPSTTLTLTGDLSVSGTYTHNSGTLIFGGSTPESVIGSNASSALFNSITIDNGSTLVSPTILNVRGNFTNNGSFTAGSNTVSFSGSAAQSITGSTNTQFYNLTVNKSTNPVTVSSPETVTNTLTLTSGSMTNASNLLTMSSGSTINRASGTITGSSPLGEPWILIYTGGGKTTGLEIPSSGNLTSITLNTTIGATITLNQVLNVATTLVIDSARIFTCGAHDVTLGSLNNMGTFNAPTSMASIGLTLNGDITNSGTFISGTGTVVIGSIVNINGTAPIFNNLSISNLGSLIAPSSLNIQGNLKNDGAFTPGSGTVIFSGNKSKQILGSSKIVFNNLTVSGGTMATDLILENTAGADLLGILNIDASVNPVVFDTDGASGTKVFTVLSGFDLPTSDGSIGILSSGSTQLPGKITVQRYMGRSGVSAYDFQVWRDISSPVNTTVSDMQNSLPVTGPFGNSSIVNSGGSPDGTVDYSISSMVRYDETVITDTNGDGKINVNDGWVDFPAASGNTTTTFFTKGQGYQMFIFGSDDPVQNTGNAKWSLRGPIWSGSFNLPVSFTSSGSAANDGWNLVGNPYPSTIDWKAASGWTKTNILPTIYIDNYNTQNGTPVFATYNSNTNVGTNGGSRYIATGQGFWVRANAASPVLTISENVKVPGTQTNFLRQSAPQDLIRVTLASGESFRDETVIYFMDQATSGFDDKYDAIKLKNRNGALNLSSLSPENDKYVINAMPFGGCSRTVALDVSDVKTGTYSLSFSEFESMPSSRNIQLKDNYKNLVVDVKQNQIYSFEVDQNNPLTFGSARFSVVFANAGEAVSLASQNLNICNSAQAKISVANSSVNYLYSMTTQDGTVVVPSTVGTGSDLSLFIPANSILLGTNQFTLKATNKSCSSMSAESAISLSLSAKPSLPAAATATNCGQGAVKLTASGASADEHYNWYDAIDAISPYPNQTLNSFTTSELTKSKTYYVSVSNSFGCEGDRVAVEANIVNLDPAVITATGLNTLQSNYNEGNQWYFNGAIITNAIGKDLNVTQSGDYKLVVTLRGCSTSTEKSMVISGDSNSEEISVYPNPVKSKLTIEANGIGDASGVIYNSLGQKISPVNFNNDGQRQLANYYFSQESNGIYFLRITQGNKVSVVRVVKE